MRSAAVLMCILLLSLGGSIHAQTKPPDSQKTEEIVFVPPKIGAPADRLGAGTRDVGLGKTDVLVLIVPEGGGLTTSDVPPLIWQLPSGFRGTMQARLSAPDGDGVAMSQTGAFPPGFYGLDLRRSDLRLIMGPIYRWQVELSDSDGVSSLAQGLVERVEDTDADPRIEGLWFDVLDPLVSVGLSGRVQITDTIGFSQLLKAGGIEP